MLKNFYIYLLSRLKDRVDGVDGKSRLKRFIRHFMTVPAKWIKSGRQNVLNIYTENQIYMELSTGFV